MFEIEIEPRPLKLGLLTHSINPRGGVVHTIELAQALADRGHDVTVFAPAAPGERLFRAVRCAFEAVPAAPVVKATREMVGGRIDAFVAYLAKRRGLDRFDLWHAHDGIGGNALATLAERGLLRSFVRTVHHLDRFDDAQVMRWQERSVRAAGAVCCVSALWQQTLDRNWGIKATLVNNGVDRQRFRPEADAGDASVWARHGLGKPSVPVVLAIGGVEARKNTLRLLQAFVMLRASRPSAQLVIAGGASLLDHDDYARSFAAALRDEAAPGLAEAVHVLGPVLDADMPALYRRADVVAMPSLREGFGLVVIEALASGTPVVASDIAPFTEYLDERCCDFADPLDSRSIAQALDRSLARGAKRRTAQSLSPTVQALCDRYSWPASAARHESVYRDVLCRARVGAAVSA